ncbi:MAG: hypothetical protein AAGH79_01635 [Bacteroidota bacterium]
MLVHLPTDEQLERMLIGPLLELVAPVLPERTDPTIDQLVELLLLLEVLPDQLLEVDLDRPDQPREVPLGQTELMHQVEVAQDHLDLMRLVDQVPDHLADLIRLADQAVDLILSEVLLLREVLAEVVLAEVLREEIKKKQDYCCNFRINAYLWWKLNKNTS